TYTAAQRAAASRAILRHGIYTSGSKSVHLDGGLHPSYVDLHGRRNPEVNGIEELLNDLRGDLFDAATALDRLDGGISLLLRCPGYLTGTAIQADALTVDVLFSPRECEAGGTELSRFLALAVQSFGSECVLPYLHRFTSRCAVESVTPRPAPPVGKSLKIHGISYLPLPEDPEVPYFRCRCRKGNSCDLAQAISLEAMPPSTFTAFNAAVGQVTKRTPGTPAVTTISVSSGIKQG
ncbi:hypothetical protein DXG01_014074, partial [Tephrocybe rancida]